MDNVWTRKSAKVQYKECLNLGIYFQIFEFHHVMNAKNVKLNKLNKTSVFEKNN